MPIYPYVCTACGHEFDALQKISDDPLTDCPECGEATLRKRLSAPAFQLKGTGWYETDFKHGGKGKQAQETAQGGDGKDKESGTPDKKAGKEQGGSKSGSKGTASGGDSKPAAAGGKDD
jgi:putative FmdB family regulatory protein